MNHIIFAKQEKWKCSVVQQVVNTRDCSGKQNQAETCFDDFWPNAGTGRLPLGSGRRGIELAVVFTSVASVAKVSCPNSYIGTLQNEIKKLSPTRPGNK